MDENNNRNFFVAILLSVVILITWQVFYAGPKVKEEQARHMREAEKVREAEKARIATPGEAAKVMPVPGAPTSPAPPVLTPEAGGAVGAGGAPVPVAPSIGRAASSLPIPPGVTRAGIRKAALQVSPRIAISTPSLTGSIALKGGRIDDLVLRKYRVSVKPASGNVALLSPSGSPHPYYAEYGWVAGDQTVRPPGKDTLWRTESAGPLTPGKPLTLVWDNGQGLTFRRTISVDEDYLFTVRQEVVNKTAKPLKLWPYALISRHGMPKTQNYYILHEGLIGVLGDEGLQEIGYSDALEEKGALSFDATGGWLGITDKYWATALVPDPKAAVKARFRGWKEGERVFFQTDYLLKAVSVPAGGRQTVEGRLFAGAKQVGIVDGYAKKHGIDRFDLLIDWGWFYFFTKPLFFLIDFFYRLVGNFGVSILIVTVLIKLAFFPLANKSYVSMSKMKKLQPEMQRFRERYKDDRQRQQQALMDLYKKEKVNPMSGCLPIVIQIPVFFALYKVLFVTIEMRHAPFFGWIRDLSVPDPTSLFNLFGLLPWAPPGYLAIGVWPFLMGISMWVQQKLNPAPTDPIQQKIFGWMPIVFTFMLARFPAGLVIYWTWNNILSLTQQWVIMSRQGVDIQLWDNVRRDFAWLTSWLAKRRKATGGS